MDQSEMANTLRAFGKGVVALRDVMDQDRSLLIRELLFIENHFKSYRWPIFGGSGSIGLPIDFAQCCVLLKFWTGS